MFLIYHKINIIKALKNSKPALWTSKLYKRYKKSHKQIRLFYKYINKSINSKISGEKI